MIITDKTFTRVGKIMTKGKKHIIPERGEEWDYLCFTCLKNSKARFLLEDYIHRIISTLGVFSNSPIEELASSLDDKILPDYEWGIVLAEIVKYSPRGYEFAMNGKRELKKEVLEEIENLHKENQKFNSQQNKNPIKR